MELLNAIGAFDEDDLETRVFGLKRPFVSAESSNDIDANTVVSITTEGEVLSATTDVGHELVIGVAQSDIEPGKTGLVTIYGAAAEVLIEGDASAGDPLTRSDTTAGRVAAATTTLAGEGGKLIGVAIADATEADGTVDMWVFKA